MPAEVTAYAIEVKNFRHTGSHVTYVMLGTMLTDITKIMAFYHCVQCIKANFLFLGNVSLWLPWQLTYHNNKVCG